MTSASDRLVRKLFGLGFAHIAVAATCSALFTLAIFRLGAADALRTLPFHDTVTGVAFGILLAALMLSTLWGTELRRENQRREQTERSLERSERKLRTLIDAVPVLIAFVDADGIVRVSNRAHSAWFGAKPGELVGQSVRDILGGQAYKENQKQIDAALAGNHVSFEGPLRNAKGDIRYAERTYIPSLGKSGEVEGYFVCVNDVTERKLREEAILRAKREITEIVESLQEGFALFDEDDHLVMSNQNYARIFPTVAELIKPGVKFEELIRAAAERGQNIEALESKEMWVQRRLDAHARPRGRFEHRFTDGRWIWVEEHKTGDGRTLSTYIDITQLKQRETELRRARDEAQVADAAKSEFLANISHELRTPLNAIMGFSEIIAEQMFGPANQQYVDYAKDINGSGDHLLNIINNLLDLSKVEAGKIELSERSIDVSDMAETCQRLIQAQAEKQGITLKTSVAIGIPSLWADDVRIKQVVLNLLSNAIKFTPSGGCVDLNIRQTVDEDLEIEVADTGIGMDEDEIAVALQPFGQLAGAYARDHQGTGLGLPLAKSLVELHGGKIVIESGKDTGTRTIVTLPKDRMRSQIHAAM